MLDSMPLFGSLPPTEENWYAVPELGSRLYQSYFTGTYDDGTLTQNLDPGQKISLVLVPDATHTGKFSVSAPGGGTAVVESPTGAAGESALLQGYSITVGGEYSILPVNEGAEPGNVTIYALLNGVFEEESIFGETNELRSQAQDLTNALSPVEGSAGTTGSVLGEFSSPGDIDWYQVSLSAGQTATVILKTESPGDESLALYDSSDNLLAQGKFIQTNYYTGVDPVLRIYEYTAATAGDYFLRLSGSPGSYNLTTVVDAAFNDHSGEGTDFVSHWAMDENAGTTLADTEGRYDLTVIGESATWVTGVSGSALSFSGTDYAICDDTSLINNGGDFALSAWVNFETLARGDVISVGNSFALRVNGGKAQAFVRNGYRWTTLTAWGAGLINDGGWHHLVGQLEGSRFELWVDGQQITSTILANAHSQYGRDRVTIGKHNSYSSNYFVGLIDQPQVYNHALSASKISDLYLAPGLMFMDINPAPERVDFTSLKTVIGSITDDSSVQEFSFLANAGDPLVITTGTPASGSGAFDNALDPVITLYDPTGVAIGKDDNTLDGQNAQLAVTTEVAGNYFVRIEGVGASRGDYSITVSGSSIAHPVFVASSDITSANLHVAPTEVDILFTNQVDPASLAPTDFHYAGVTPLSVTLVDQWTARLEVLPIADGMNYEFSINAGDILDIFGQPVSEFATTFNLDTISPTITAGSLVEGDILELNPQDKAIQVSLTFSEDVSVAYIQPGDIRLIGATSGHYNPSAMTYDPGTLVMDIDFENLAEDSYTLFITSDNLQDAIGRPLDGEPASLVSYPSGDGTPGGDFSVTFEVDFTDVTLDKPWRPLDAWGATAYGLENITGRLNSGTDTDTYTAPFEEGQLISLLLQYEGDTPPTITRQLPSGENDVIVAAPTADHLLAWQGFATQTGLYEFDIASGAASPHDYSLDLYWNTALEGEMTFGLSNDNIAQSQSLDADAFVSDGVGEHTVILGHADPLLNSDWYSFMLDDGNEATLVLNQDLSTGIDLGLYDAAGTLLATGVNDNRFGQRISSFVDTTTDGSANQYHVRIANAVLDYSLAVTRGAGFENESLDPLVSGENTLSTTSRTLGSLGEGETVSPETVGHVVFISLDGAGGIYLKDLLASRPEDYPTIRRFELEGAFTYNARTDYTHTVTLPNHTAMATGRPVMRPNGWPATRHHNWTSNSDPLPGVNLHNNQPYVDYVASVFDVAHDAGLSTSLFAGKSKFSLFVDSFDADSGSPDLDPTGGDNGPNKIDYSWINSNDAASLTDAFITAAGDNDFNYSFLHYAYTDSIGHSYGWGSETWNEALSLLDAQLARLMEFIENDPDFADDTTVVITADHGGIGTGHYSVDEPIVYSVPFFVHGPGVPAGTDLYELDPYRFDPLAGRPDFNSPKQPIRNGSAANLSLELLGLSPIPDSSINTERPDEVDSYKVAIASGETITVSTTTPFDGTVQGTNLLDPMVVVYAPDGSFAALDFDGAGDDRNASATFIADQTGMYTVVIARENGTTGEYVLAVAGSSLVTRPTMEVVNSSVTDGQHLSAFPQDVTLEFSDNLLLTSLDTNDFTVNGMPASSFEILDGETVRFTIDPSVNTGEGVYAINVAADILSSVTGQLNDSFSAIFSVDLMGPRLTEAIVDGDPAASLSALNVNTTGLESIALAFDESVLLADPSEISFRKVSFNGGTPIEGAAVSPLVTQQTKSNEFTFFFTPGDVVNTWLQVRVGDGAITDLAGNSIDGEPPASGSGNTFLADPDVDLPSGDGNVGGDALFYVANMAVDINEDLRTDAADLSILLSNFGQTLRYDLDHSGVVDAMDVSIVSADFGALKPTDLTQDGHIDHYDIDLLMANYGGAGAGDINGSGVVDSADLNLLLSSLGAIHKSDVNHDGAIDSADLNLVLSSMGERLPIDPILDGRVDQADLDLVLQHLGTAINPLPLAASPDSLVALPIGPAAPSPATTTATTSSTEFTFSEFGRMTRRDRAMRFFS